MSIVDRFKYVIKANSYKNFKRIKVDTTHLCEQVTKECKLFSIDAVGDSQFYGCLRCDLEFAIATAKKAAKKNGYSLKVVGDIKSRFSLLFNFKRKLALCMRVDVWREEDELFKLRSKNIFARRVPSVEFKRVYDEDTRRLQLKKLYQYPVDAECDFEIDFVFTWVNHDDLEWRELIAEYKDVSDIEWDRYISIDELRYSLRSVYEFAPWVRRIYVVTNCAPPSWYISDPRLIFVPHEEIFSSVSECLPTFNSHAIESCLANIPGLSEYFVYFNDDFFLAKPAAKDVFFTSNGCSISYLEDYGMVVGEPEPIKPDYMNAAINGRRLIEKTFSRSPTQLHRHVPYALIKSTLVEMENNFSQEYAKVRAARFRTIDDISVPSFLYHHYAYQKKAAVRESCSSVLVHSENYEEKFRSLLNRGGKLFFCINDGNNSASDRKFLAAKASFLSAMFPDPAPWERSQ